jgi:hypothetical protein
VVIEEEIWQGKNENRERHICCLGRGNPNHEKATQLIFDGMYHYDLSQ